MKFHPNDTVPPVLGVRVLHTRVRSRGGGALGVLHRGAGDALRQGKDQPAVYRGRGLGDKSER